MKKISSKLSAHRVATAAAVVLAAGAAATVPSAAQAAAPPSYGVTVSNVTVPLYGTGDLDVTLAEPTAGDAYLQVYFIAPAGNRMTVTDDAGNPLPMTTTSNLLPLFTFGEDDSDHNGIPGAPLPAGTVHLHVSAQAPIPAAGFQMSAQVIDGATGNVVAHSGLGTTGHLFVQEPTIGPIDWKSPDAGIASPMSTVTIKTGDPRLTTGYVYTNDGRVPVPGGTSTRLTLTAASIAASGYTSQQLAQALHIGSSADDDTFSPVTWKTAPDGSLSAQLPTHPWSVNGAAYEYIGITTDWGLPAGTLPALIQTYGNDDRPYTEDHVTFTFTADSVPGALLPALYGRDTAGVLWQYEAASDPTAAPGRLSTRYRVGSGWNAYTAISPLGTLKADGTGDLVARDTTGDLWYYQGTGQSASPFAPRNWIGSGWNTYTTITAAGDITGDGHPDLLARDTTGVLWYYRGTGNPYAPFAARTRVGSGWNTYTTITAAGDITGDGHPDLLAVDHDGKLWLYRGTGNPTAPYAARVQVGNGWNIYTRIVGIGDMSRNGHPDLLATDTTGNLWYYQGTGQATSPYRARTQAGHGWNIYNTLF